MSEFSLNNSINISGSMDPGSVLLYSNNNNSPVVQVGNGTLNAGDMTTVEYQEPPRFTEISLIKTVILAVIFTISLLGNSLTIVQMYRMRKRKSTINTLILHLATADLIVTFFCILTETIWGCTIQWLGGNFLCKIVKYIQVFGLYLSTYVVVIVALDRCCAILDPLGRSKAPTRVRVMIIVAWCLSALFSIPQAIIFSVKRGPFEEHFVQCVTHGFFKEQWYEDIYAILSLVTMFIIPLVTMVIAYTLIFLAITRTSKEFQEEGQATSSILRGQVRSQLLRKAKTKSVIMTTVIVAAFILCWTPYYIIYFLHIFAATSSQTMESIQEASQWVFFFGMANSMLNPMIYGAFHVCKSKRYTYVYMFINMASLISKPA